MAEDRIKSPAGDRTDDRADVLAANAAFYAALEGSDIDAMRAVWSDQRDCVCIHPGAEPIHGTASVMRSWSLIMAHTPYIQFFLTDVEVSVVGDTAAVTLTENILAGVTEAGDSGFEGGRAAALNVFLRTPDGWRLWVHQSAPVLSEAT